MKFSLKMKTILLIVSIAVLISAGGVLVFDKGLRDVVETQYEDRSIDIAKLVALQTDAERLRSLRDKVLEIYYKSPDVVLSDQWGSPEFNAYVAQYAAIEETEDFLILREDLRRMQDSLDVDCLYYTWIDAPNVRYIYLADAAYEDACAPGVVDPVYLTDLSPLKDPKIGLPPNITNTPEYGWLIATVLPVFDKDGEVVAYACVDISMNDIMAQQRRFLMITVAIFMAATVIVCILGIWLVTRFITDPINKLSQAASHYTRDKKSFSELNLSRNDEIGTLADSMALMETEIGKYIDNLEKMTNDLIAARENAEQFNRIANIDPLTMVRNKRAYDIEAGRLNAGSRPYALVMIDVNGLKVINDTYGHEKGDDSIKAVSSAICRVFKHSTVYRVGGDEFIVILENDDYTDREALIKAITAAFARNASNTKLEPWERATAAVGCAVFSPATDSSAADVLKRADEAMYANKREMKK